MNEQELDRIRFEKQVREHEIIVLNSVISFLVGHRDAGSLKGSMTLNEVIRILVEKVKEE